jgi:hypothetical protein
MAEESKLVEEVVETTEATEKKEDFNPLAFAGDDTYGTKEDIEEEKKEEKQEVEAKEEQTEEQEQEDGWSWDSKTENQTEKEEEYNWDGVEEKTEEAPTAQEALNWSKVGEELGIEIKSKDEFVQALNSLQQQAQKQQAPVNQQVAELNSYLNFSDRDLVAEELKADGIEDSEIEESLDKLEDSGMMKMKAKSIRRVITNAIDQQTAQAQQQQQQSVSQRKQQAENARKELKGQIKNN